MEPPPSLRPVQPEDREFLFQVYAGTRQEELSLVDWDEAQKASFLRQQFDAQDRYYRENYPGAEFWVITWQGEPVGRLYLHRQPGELRIMDIALLPAFRARGLGTSLLGDIIAQGERAGVPVTIHVERFNPALRLYQRLGFVLVEDRGVYWFLERRPSKPLPPPDQGRSQAASLEQLSSADFSPLVGQAFWVPLASGERYELTLAAVKELGNPYIPGGRRPFSLIFTNPRTDAYLPQATYLLEHAQLGLFELFLVPLGPDQPGMRYEVIFT
jgi:ribosomal protein S18 acetylase RimI-like enzyme